MTLQAIAANKIVNYVNLAQEFKDRFKSYSLSEIFNEKVDRFDYHFFHSHNFEEIFKLVDPFFNSYPQTIPHQILEIFYNAMQFNNDPNKFLEDCKNPRIKNDFLNYISLQNRQFTTNLIDLIRKNNTQLVVDEIDKLYKNQIGEDVFLNYLKIQEENGYNALHCAVIKNNYFALKRIFQILEELPNSKEEKFTFLQMKIKDSLFENNLLFLIFQINNKESIQLFFEYMKKNLSEDQIFELFNYINKRNKSFLYYMNIDLYNTLSSLLSKEKTIQLLGK
jgi:hypothetical protein